MDSKKLTIHGTGQSLRNFIHIDDVNTAFETILLKGEIGQIYNISSDHENEYSVLDLAKILIKLFHPNLNLNDPHVLSMYIDYVTDRNFNDARYFISSKKLYDLGWKPVKTNFEQNLKELVDWYRINRNRYQI